MGLSLVQRFGKGATLDNTTPTAPKLIIDLSDLKNTADGGDITDGRGLNDVSNITALNIDTKIDKILTALFVLWMQKQPIENNDKTVGLYVLYNYKNYETRDGEEQKLYSYTANFYTPDTEGDLDPDDVVTA